MYETVQSEVDESRLDFAGRHGGVVTFPRITQQYIRDRVAQITKKLCNILLKYDAKTQKGLFLFCIVYVDNLMKFSL